MDTKFWGPSGWKMLHLITFERGSLAKKKKLFTVLGEVLPCKYCRQSTREYIREEPPQNNLALWLYNLHKKVNQKLESQGLNPAPSPGFTQVIRYYREELKNAHLPGVPFLLSMAYNYDSKMHSREAHETFWNALKDLYPKNGLPRVPKIHDCYFRDVFEILVEMGFQGSYSETLQEIAKHKSPCSKKTFRGRTCRKPRKR
jgi:hypothetical protein